ncbi:MAG: tRNA methyltransferase [Rhodospirillaceae bacterium]|nr:tRNA methyltransferase [Rhodospirillaceae bacterium]
MRIALYQPDIPQNTGTIIRLAACFAVPLDIIEPCGFTLSDTRLRRAGLDYAQRATITRHISWQNFLRDRPTGRLVLSTSKGEQSLKSFSFDANDTLLFGSEASGVPCAVHQIAERRVRVPLATGERSLNLAVCAGIVLWEAWRQTGSAVTRYQR